MRCGDRPRSSPGSPPPRAGPAPLRPGGRAERYKGGRAAAAARLPAPTMAPERPPPAFAEAGQRCGLQVWRVEQLELVPVPPSLHGDFFVGDAYLVLHTHRPAAAAAAYRLHYWLGRQRGRGRRGPGCAPRLCR